MKHRIPTAAAADACPRPLADLPGSLHAVPRSSLESIARAAAGLTVAPAGQPPGDAYRKVLADGLEQIRACIVAAVERLPLPVERAYGKRLEGLEGTPPFGSFPPQKGGKRSNQAKRWRHS